MPKILRLALFLALIAALCAASALADTLTLPASTRTVEAEAFRGDTSLSEVLLPEGLTAIGDFAFAETSVTRIYLPETLTDIGEDAFTGSAALRAWGLPDTE